MPLYCRRPTEHFGTRMLDLPLRSSFTVLAIGVRKKKRKEPKPKPKPFYVSVLHKTTNNTLWNHNFSLSFKSYKRAQPCNNANEESLDGEKAASLREKRQHVSVQAKFFPDETLRGVRCVLLMLLLRKATGGMGSLQLYRKARWGSRVVLS